MWSITWSSTVTVVLNTIPPEPLQIAESRIADLEQQLEALKAEQVRSQAAKEDQRSLFLFYPCTSGACEAGKVIRWRRTIYDPSSVHFVLDENGTVKFKTSGLYMVVFVANHSHQSATGGHFELVGNKKKLMKATTSDTTSFLAQCLSFAEGECVWMRRKFMTEISRLTLLIMPALPQFGEEM